MGQTSRAARFRFVAFFSQTLGVEGVAVIAADAARRQPTTPTW